MQRGSRLRPPNQREVTTKRLEDHILIENFLEALAAERGAAANTLDSYGRDLKAFAKRLGRPLQEAEPENVRSYLEAMDRQGLAPTTAARRLSALRQFYKFLYAEGLSRRNPAANIESPRRRHRLGPRALAVAVVRVGIAACAPNNFAHSYRSP